MAKRPKKSSKKLTLKKKKMKDLPPGDRSASTKGGGGALLAIDPSLSINSPLPKLSSPDLAVPYVPYSPIFRPLPGLGG